MFNIRCDSLLVVIVLKEHEVLKGKKGTNKERPKYLETRALATLCRVFAGEGFRVKQGVGVRERSSGDEWSGKEEGGINKTYNKEASS